MNKKFVIFLLFFTIVISISLLSNQSIPFSSMIGVDWDSTFRPAARMVLAGENPYTIATFRNVPWTILPLLPFAVLPEAFSGKVFFIANIFLYAFVAKKAGASTLGIIAFLLSPPVMYGLKMSNVDVLVLLGFTLPPTIGLFFILIKPQMGIMMFFFWLVKTLKRGGWKETLKTFAPVTITMVMAIVFFDYSPLQRSFTLIDTNWNARLWPWALPLGLLFFATSVRNLTAEGAIAASPFLSPYLAYHSWAGALLALIKKDFELMVVVLGMWLVFLVRFFS